MVFITPGIYSLSDEKPGDIPSTYNLDNQKINVLSKFEKKAVEESGKFDLNKIEVGRRVIEGYWNNDSVQIMNLEKNLRNSLLQIIEKQEKYAALTPMTFYLTTCFEVSSYGNRAFIAMYDYLIDLYRKFLRFWFDRVYYNDPKIMVNFVKNDENVFTSQSLTQGNFKTGFFINLGIVVILAILSYFAFLHSIFRIKHKELSQLGAVDVKLAKGDFKVWLVKKDHFKNLLFNLFSGKFKTLKRKGCKGSVLLNKADLTGEKNKENFLYVCRPGQLPGDIKVKDFIALYAGILKLPAAEKNALLDMPGIKEFQGKLLEKLDNSQRFSVLLCLLQLGKNLVYLIDNIATGLPVECAVALKTAMEALKDRGCIVIYLTTTVRPDSKPVKMDEYFYEDTPWWTSMVGENAKITEIENKSKKRKEKEIKEK
ncbi:MAG: hypothetical protein KAW12_11325 [Candidatus Aminicenantes bacterium]|nr:hypothetical protein [Candidatus Aminicenantes bacterium]